MDAPRTRYTKAGDLNIAYQVLGDGPFDLVNVHGWVSNLEIVWDQPLLARWLRRLASFSRLILLDKRGTGLSDRVAQAATLEERMDDVRAVMDAVGSDQAAILGYFDAAPMCALFAATYPERTRALVLSSAFPKLTRDEDLAWAPPRETFLALTEAWEAGQWGDGEDLFLAAPSMVDDEAFRAWWARNERLSASPGAAAALLRMMLDIDVRPVLPSIRVPTLVMHRAGETLVDPRSGHYVAEHIRGARFLELPGVDTIPYVGNADAGFDAIQEFLTGSRPVPEVDRVLATVLFTDIVQSTTLAATWGDRRWRATLDDHDEQAGRVLDRFRGRLIKSTGDGLLATFDGPARAIRCAWALREDARTLGLEIRAGLHTGEIELRGDDIGGIAVHIGQRICSLARPAEVLVSRTVADLVAGSGLTFVARGEQELKGVQGPWAVYAASA
jgi:class 3 adenylate cyclase